MTETELSIIVSKISEQVVEKLRSDHTVVSMEGDFSISDIRKILGVGNSAAYTNTYHGEYRHNGRRMVRREEFLYRCRMGLDVCKKNEK